MKCPFCSGELENTLGQVYECKVCESLFKIEIMFDEYTKGDKSCQ